MSGINLIWNSGLKGEAEAFKTIIDRKKNLKSTTTEEDNIIITTSPKGKGHRKSITGTQIAGKQ